MPLQDLVEFVPRAAEGHVVDIPTPAVDCDVTSSTGWISTKVTASRTGAWRLRYGGNTIASATTSAGDMVTVS